MIKDKEKESFDLQLQFTIERSSKKTKELFSITTDTIITAARDFMKNVGGNNNNNNNK